MAVAVVGIGRAAVGRPSACRSHSPGAGRA
jgi:hypothetical protein